MKRRLPRTTTPATLFFAIGLLIWYVFFAPKNQLSQSQKITPTPSTVLPSPTVTVYTTPIPTFIVDQVDSVTPAPSIQPSDQARVTRIIDGDTIEIATGQKVRYIGVDTPELHKTGSKPICFGQQARDENLRLVAGKTVKLVKDVSETDRYGRLLRYVYITGADGTELFINEYLIKEGYAYSVTFPPDVRYADYFRSLQRQAEEQKKGLWDSCRK